MDTELLEKIEAHLAGDISYTELEAFAKTQGVESIEDEINWFKEMQLAIEAEGLSNQLKNELNTSSAKEESKVVEMPVKKQRGKLFPLSIAAALILLFGILFIFKPKNTSQTYSKYEFVDPGLPLLMSETEAYNLYDAMTYFSEGNYKESATRLEQLHQQQPENDTINYYLGLSKLYDGNGANAIDNLNIVTQINNSVFKERADWMLVLSYLKQKNLNQTKVHLQPILENSKHSFYKQAQQLKEEL